MRHLLLITLFLSSSLFAQDRGGCGGHGGDGYSLEFYRLGKHLAQEFKSWGTESFVKLGIKFNPKQFEHVVENTRIVSVTEDLVLDGRPVDAINYSEREIPSIELNRQRWDSYAFKRLKKIGVVLHEYLGIMKGVYGHGEWDNYVVSSDLLDIYEDKVVHEQVSNYSARLARIEKAFKKAGRFKIPSKYETKNDFPWSCVEFSALRGDTSKFIHQDAYIFDQNGNLGNWHPEAQEVVTTDSYIRQWYDTDPTESRDQPKSVMKEYLRSTAEGDLIVELTTDYKYSNQKSSLSAPSRGLLSYLYCSKVGNKSLAMTKYMRDSLNPIFDLPKQSDYRVYVSKIRELSTSKLNQKCRDQKKDQACLKVIKRLDTFTLPYESRAVESAKKNITGINVWLESLEIPKKNFAIEPLTKLFNKFITHQTYLKGLLDVMDSHVYPDIGLDQFTVSLTDNVPNAYAEAKIAFEREYQDIRQTFVMNFDSELED